MPRADDIFRPTAVPDPPAAAPQAVEAEPVPLPRVVEAEPEAERGPRAASGRIRHDEKVTVYVTSDELLDIEHARLLLRREHGLAVDRGRLVRNAVALALADLEACGADSAIVQRLNEA